MKSRQSLPLVFIIPTVSILAIIALVPTIFAFNVSFQETTLSSPVSGYVGFGNYLELMRDHRFLNALKVSLKWEVITVFSTMALAIVLGVLLFDNTGPRARAVLTLIFLVPVLLPRVCAAFVWKFAFHPLYGIVTYPYRLVFGTTLDMLADGSRPCLPSPSSTCGNGASSSP